jgi:hypothetical protein
MAFGTCESYGALHPNNYTRGPPILRTVIGRCISRQVTAGVFLGFLTLWCCTSFVKPHWCSKSQTVIYISFRLEIWGVYRHSSLQCICNARNDLTDPCRKGNWVASRFKHGVGLKSSLQRFLIIKIYVGAEVLECTIRRASLGMSPAGKFSGDCCPI